MSTYFNHVKFGNGLTVTDEGSNVIRVDAGSGSGGVFTLLNYTEFTANVTVSATSAATAGTLVAASGAVTVDGSTLICVEFYCPSIVVGATAGSLLLISLWQGSTDLGVLTFSGDVGQRLANVLARRYLTPSAGTYTYTVKAYRGTSNGTVTAGAGGADTPLPGYIRVTSGT